MDVECCKLFFFIFWNHNMIFLFFILFICYNILIGLWISNHPCIPVIITLYHSVWTFQCIAEIGLLFFRYFASMFIWDIVLNFIFVMSLSSFVIRVMLVHRKILEASPSLPFFCNSLSKTGIISSNVWSWDFLLLLG